MQKLVALLLIAVLAGSVTIPNVFSDDEKNTNDNNENENHQNQTSTNENENNNHENKTSTKENEDDNKTKVHFGFSNATSVTITLPNGTKLTFGFSNGTNPGQQISDFIHKIRDAFKQQETQAKQLIKDCREKARDATNHADKKTIMDQCKAQLKQINQQFRGEHKLFQLDFKQFRETVIGNNQENHEKQDNDTKGKNTAQIIPPHGLAQIKPHGKQNDTKFQNSSQFAPNQHGLDEKQKHGKQNETKKHEKDD